MNGNSIDEEKDKTITFLERVRKEWYNKGIKLEDEGVELEEEKAADTS